MKSNKIFIWNVLFLNLIILPFNQSHCAGNQNIQVTGYIENAKAIHETNWSLNEKMALISRYQLKYLSKQEAMIVNEAKKRVKNFFKQNGYDLDIPINIEFVESVKAKIIKGKNCAADGSQVIAAYNCKTKLIKVTHMMTAYCKNGKLFGSFPIDMEFYTSIITHEIAHCFFDFILESKNEKTDQAFSEFIAYITQISTMKENHKTKVLTLWEGERLPSIYAINPFLWLAEPNKFGVMSYRFFKKKPIIFQQILDCKIKPISFGLILDY